VQELLRKRIAKLDDQIKQVVGVVPLADKADTK
jgi:hypothetical protein